MVYLKMQPYRTAAFGLKHALKLASKFYGPFMVLNKMRKVAYKLQLPDNVGIHPVFHVSQLKKHCRSKVVPSPELSLVGKDGRIKIEPIEVLETRALPRTNLLVTQWLVQWLNLSSENATWEDVDIIKSTFPEFYSGAIKSWFPDANT